MKGSISTGSFGESSVWRNAEMKEHALDVCIRHGPREQEDRNRCLSQFMEKDGASREAISFFNLTGRWLLGFLKGTGAIDVGFAVMPDSAASPVDLLFMNANQAVMPIEDLLDLKNPIPLFKTDPNFPIVVQDLQEKYGPNLEILRLDSGQVVAFASYRSERDDVIVKSALQSSCYRCMVGLDALYKFSFTGAGVFSGVQFLGLCREPGTTGQLPSGDYAVPRTDSRVPDQKDTHRESLPTCPEALS